MRAAVVDGPGSVRIEEREPSTLPDDRVEVAPAFVGLCGSDVSYFTKGVNGAFVIEQPLVLGHEVTATVLRSGAAVADPLPAGTRVVVHPVWPSPEAGQTAISEMAAADAPAYLGSAATHPHTDGALSETLVVRREQLRVIPDSLPFRRATLAEPLSVVLHALDRLPVEIAGRDVLVCGAGPIGLLLVACAVHFGARSITATDLHDRPLAIATDLGATAVVNLADGAEAPKDAFDLVIEATGVPASLSAAIRGAKEHAVVLQLGMIRDADLAFNLSGVVTKELTVLGSFRFGAELDRAIELLPQLPGLDGIVSDVLELDDVEEAFRRAADARGSSKVMVDVQGTGDRS